MRTDNSVAEPTNQTVTSVRPRAERRTVAPGGRSGIVKPAEAPTSGDRRGLADAELLRERVCRVAGGGWRLVTTWHDPREPIGALGGFAAGGPRERLVGRDRHIARLRLVGSVRVMKSAGEQVGVTVLFQRFSPQSRTDCPGDS